MPCPRRPAWQSDNIRSAFHGLHSHALAGAATFQPCGFGRTHETTTKKHQHQQPHHMNMIQNDRCQTCPVKYRNWHEAGRDQGRQTIHQRPVEVLSQDGAIARGSKTRDGGQLDGSSDMMRTHMKLRERSELSRFQVTDRPWCEIPKAIAQPLSVPELNTPHHDVAMTLPEESTCMSGTYGSQTQRRGMRTQSALRNCIWDAEVGQLVPSRNRQAMRATWLGGVGANALVPRRAVFS